MQSYRKLFVLIACSGILAACEESAVPTDTETSLELTAKPGASAVYNYTLSGDIEGTLNGVLVSGGDPFKQLSAGQFAFSFPDSSMGDTGVCDSKNPELTPSVNDWGSYDAAGWAGQIELSRRRRGAFHLQITGTQSDTDGGSMNLAVNDVVVEGSEEGNPVIIFTDARALVSAFSYADILGDAPDYDPDDRCVNFKITADPQ